MSSLANFTITPPAILFPPPLLPFLAAIGGLVIAHRLLKLLSWVRLNYLTGTANLRKRYANPADPNSVPWAVVTGASDGIGKALAIELSRHGLNLVLMARTVAKLEAVAAECRKNGVETKVIPFDFAAATIADYKRLDIETLEKLDVAMLVNNVGNSHKTLELVENHPTEDDVQMIRINVDAHVHMTKLVLPRMKTRNNGAILFMSSAGARLCGPFLALYSATKCFTAGFATALASEVRHNNIDVLTLTPGFVATQMSRKKTVGGDTISPEHFAKVALHKLGKTRASCGAVVHQLQAEFMAMLPRSVLERMIEKILSKLPPKQ